MNIIQLLLSGGSTQMLEMDENGSDDSEACEHKQQSTLTATEPPEILNPRPHISRQALKPTYTTPVLKP